MSADAKLDAEVGRQVGVALDETRLHLDRPAHRIDHAMEFDENAVAGALDDAPMRRGVGGLDQIAAEAAKTRKGSLFPAPVSWLEPTTSVTRIGTSFRVSLTAAHPRRAGKHEDPAKAPFR